VAQVQAPLYLLHQAVAVVCRLAHGRQSYLVIGPPRSQRLSF